MVTNISSAKIARPYAEALFAIAKSECSLDAITLDIQNLRNLLKIEALKDYLNNPIIRPSTKREIIKKTISPQVTTQTSKFLMTLIDRNRISFLGPIAERYLELVYELANTKIIEVVSVQPLTAKQRKNLTYPLQIRTNAKEVKLLNTIDSSLIGGFLIKADSKMVDLSIKGQLNQFAKHLDNVLKI
jgi:F-type H+-transporting ATPase subunit delta